MAVKQFPQDFQQGAAVKLIGATADGTPVYIVVPAGGDTLDSVTNRSNSINNALQFLGAGKFPTSGIGGEIYYDKDAGAIVIQAYGRSSFSWKNVNIGGAGGNTGFGIPNPLQKVHVAGNILATGSITPGSDKRLKFKIRTLDNSLESLLKLRPVTYFLKYDKAPALGFIADEVREIFPDLVIEGKDDEKMLAMNYMGLTAPIVKAIQELSAQVASLKAEVDQIKGK